MNKYHYSYFLIGVAIAAGLTVTEQGSLLKAAARARQTKVTMTLPAANLAEASRITTASEAAVGAVSDSSAKGQAAVLNRQISLLVADHYYPSADKKLLALESLTHVSQPPVPAPDQSAQVAAEARSSLLTSWGVDGNIISQVNFGLHVPILYFHHVLADGSPCGGGENDGPSHPNCARSVYAGQLDAELSWLDANGWNAITLDQLSDALRRGAQLPAKPYIVTFDDGYASLYRNGLPVLAKHKTKAVFYVIPGLTAGSDGSWYMTWRMLDDAHANHPYISLMDHTMIHADLKGQTASYDASQIVGAKDALQGRYGAPVKHFCYPYGAFDQRAQDQAFKAGMLTATSTIEGSYQKPDYLYSLRRSRVSVYTNMALFEKIMTGK